MKNKLSLMLIRAVTFPSLFMPYSWVHAMGRFFGTIAYHLYPEFRRRTLSNIALALNPSEKELIALAKKSMQNLMITCLDYPKLAWEKDIHNLAYCVNPEEADTILKSGKGVIFFCAHQANWEVLFLEGTKRMPGVAIGRPVKNSSLYDWVLSIRQKYGGKIITPQNAIREGLRGLKHGAFLGIVGDQGMPDSGYSSPFFGHNAWTSPMPALLSYRTGSPIFVAMTKREKGKYRISYSEPIWPNKEASQEQEIDRMMRKSLSILEESIRIAPDEWMWQHNRWKQQTTRQLKRAFRHESILIILPKGNFQNQLQTLREIYPLEFITVLAHKDDAIDMKDVTVIRYEKPEELFIRDYRFKLVFNMTDIKELNRFYRKLAALQVVGIAPDQNLKELVYRAPQ